MRKMSTFVFKLLTLLLVLTISLSSCDVITSILGDSLPGVEDGVTDDTEGDNESPEDEGNLPSDDEGNKPDGEGNKPDGEGNKPEDTHTHTYAQKLTAPTCTLDGYTTYTCECGDSYTADKVAKLGHSYKDGECTVCGESDPNYVPPTADKEFNYSDVPEYAGENFAVINGNTPYFTKNEITSDFFESYSDLDMLGRVGTAFACLGKETLPTGERGSLSHNPTGWVQNNYPTYIVSTTQIYNRSHLIAWSLSGEDNNAKNLMTGTPYFNQIGMQIFETMVLDYIKETGNHVMYRVTPVFLGNDLLARGVLMEGWSVEDNGDGICFCVFMYNVQPGVVLEYETGKNYAEKTDNDGADKKSATLVTDLSQIKAGDKIIIVAKNANYALGGISTSGNNMMAIEIEKDGNTVYFGDKVAVITLENGKTAGTFGLAVSGGYLYAASSSKNHLKIEKSLSANSSWSFAISGGIATIKSTGTYSRNWLRYNSSNMIFAAYGSGQQDVCIYVVNE